MLVERLTGTNGADSIEKHFLSFGVFAVLVFIIAALYFPMLPFPGAPCRWPQHDLAAESHGQVAVLTLRGCPHMYMFLPLFVENRLRISQTPKGSGYVSDSARVGTVTGVGASDTERVGA